MIRRNHAVYFLGLLSYVVSLIPFTGLKPLGVILALAMSLYVLPILDYLQPKFTAWKLSAKDLALAVASGLPYAIVMILLPSALYAIPVLLLGGARCSCTPRRKACGGT